MAPLPQVAAVIYSVPPRKRCPGRSPPHPAHSYPTPHARIPRCTLASEPRLLASMLALSRPCCVGGRASWVALSPSSPLPGSICTHDLRQSGRWHSQAGDPPPLIRHPPQAPPTPVGPLLGLALGCGRGVGAPGQGFSPQHPGPGGKRAAAGPFLGCRGRRGGLPRRARPLISCLTGSLGSCCRKTFANIPEEPGSA